MNLNNPDLRYIYHHRHEPDLEALLRDKHRKDSAGRRYASAPQATVYRGRSMPATYRKPTKAALAVYNNITLHLTADWLSRGLGYDIDYVERATTQLLLPGATDHIADFASRRITAQLKHTVHQMVHMCVSDEILDPPADAYALFLFFAVALRIARNPDKSAAIARIQTMADIVAACEVAANELAPIVATLKGSASAYAHVLDLIRKIPEPYDGDDKSWDHIAVPPEHKDRDND